MRIHVLFQHSLQPSKKLDLPNTKNDDKIFILNLQ